MSKLSELLNPAPSSQSSPPAAPQSPLVQPLILDGQDRRSHCTSSVSHGAGGNHTVYNSLTSPGLEALAAAASNTAPMLSPTQNSHTFADPAPFQPSSSPHYSSRPSSTHTTLPPLPHDFSHPSSHQAPPHSAGLEQYHHMTSGERRLSNVTDHSAHLAPLQQSPPDHSTSFPTSINGGELPVDNSGNNLDIGTEQLETSPQLGYRDHPEDSHPDAKTTSQVGQPSPGHSPSLPATDLPETQSDQVAIKAETSETILDMPHNTLQYDGPAPERPASGANQHPLKASTPIQKSIADIKKHSSHTPSPKPTEKPSGASTQKPKPALSKKRAAPKKGTASTVKPAAKKRKIDSESINGTPPSKSAGTPATSRASATPAPKSRQQASITPARSSSEVNGQEEEDDDDDDDGKLFCICRKPDDHGLMICCDGPCEDWFHASCVSLDHGKAELIYKWFCPSCAEKGNETLWKRMCRLEGCNRPARLDEENFTSKYCSDEHGVEFMERRVPGQSTGPKRTSTKKRKQDNYTDNIRNTGDDASEPDDRTHLRGGVLSAAEVKAVADGVKDVDAFHKLGDGVLSPPPTVSPEGDDVKMEDADGAKKDKVVYTAEEKTQLEEISTKRENARAKKKMLDDRDKLLVLINARKEVVLAELKESDKSFKDICGYDTRLSWSDTEFNDWRASSEGQNALQKGGVLGAPAPIVKTAKEGIMDDLEEEKEGNNEEASADKGKEEEEVGRGVCKKKRCERHKAWIKLQTQDNAFEKDQVRQEMRKLETEEKGLKDRAMIRTLEGAEVEEEA